MLVFILTSSDSVSVVLVSISSSVDIGGSSMLIEFLADNERKGTS